MYLAILKGGECSANTIAKKCGLHRQVVYDILDRLIEKSLAGFVIRGSKKFFSASSPSMLLENLKEKEDALSKIMPSLVAMENSGKKESFVRVIQGKEVVTSILKSVYSVLESGKAKEHLLFGCDDRKYMQYSGIFMKKFISMIDKNNFHERVLAKEGESYFIGGRNSEYKFIPKEFFNPTETHIAGNLIAIIIWGDPLTGIIIESEEVADSYKKYFNLLWKMAKRGKWRTKK